MTKKEEKEKYPEWYKKGHLVLLEEKSPKIEKLFEHYQKDKYLARVIYMNNPSGYQNWKTMLFTEENGHFSIVIFVRTFGISKTNRMYSREKRVMTLTYNGKFWLVVNSNVKKVTQLTINNLYGATPSFGGGRMNNIEIILDKLEERFTWLRFIREHNVLANVALNTIVSKKLYSLKKALQHEYKTPLPIANMLKKHKTKVFLVDNLKYHLPYLDKIETLKEEWLTNNDSLHIFHDTLRMAKILDKKVNCNWTTRRLKEEHDNWSKELTDIIFIDGDREMAINETFIKFEKSSAYELLKTTKEMAYEGKRQNHCVATYVDKVERGECGIYRIKDYTLELVWGWTNGKRMLKIGQLRGYSNTNAPKYLEDEVLTNVVKFNNEVLSVNVSKEQIGLNKNEGWINDNELPF